MSVLPWVVLVAFALTPVSSANASQQVGRFSDDDGNTHESAIEAIAQAGLTIGCNPTDSTLYCPAETVRRGQMAQFLDRAFQWSDTTYNFFIDDENRSYEPSVNRMAAAGVTLGCGGSTSATFCPEDKLTREQAVALIDRALNLPSTTNHDYFSDDNGSPFEDAINRVAAAGITKGCDGANSGRFCPTEYMQRDEMASFLQRALGLTASESSSTNPEFPPADAGPPPTAPGTSLPDLGSGGGWWVPPVGASWQWQLTGSIDTSVDADVYNIDLFDVDTSVVDTLTASGVHTICYMSAGSYEDWRPDAQAFPSAVLGKTNGWAGERWLDIRRIDVLGPIMEARMDLCKAKGFDGVEVDNIDGYANKTGFSLTAQDQLTYNRFLADAAHDRGLSIGLKNDVDQVKDLVDAFDYAINEECYEWNECDRLIPFIAAGKAVFHVEYNVGLNSFCPTTTGYGFSSLKKRLDLDAWRKPCP